MSLGMLLLVTIVIAIGWFFTMFMLITWGSVKLVFNKKFTVIESLAAGMVLTIIALIVAIIITIIA